MDTKLQEKLNILSKMIGNTPMLSLGDGLYGKLEGKNPAGSIKDRAAFYMVMRALEKGDLKERGTIVEATSGNTGIGLSYVARELGLKAVIVMPESMSKERRDMISSCGAEWVLTPASEGMAGAVRKANEIAKSGAWLANQFGNYAIVEARCYARNLLASSGCKIRRCRRWKRRHGNGRHEVYRAKRNRLQSGCGRAAIKPVVHARTRRRTQDSRHRRKLYSCNRGRVQV